MRASDQGTPTQSTEIVVTIRIRREGNPSFAQAEFIVTLPEDTALNSRVIQVEASDPLQVCALTFFFFYQTCTSCGEVMNWNDDAMFVNKVLIDCYVNVLSFL